MNENKELKSGISYLITLVIYFFVGGWAVSYLVTEFLGKHIPYFGACLIGLVTGALSITAGIVTWLLHVCGVL